MNTYHLHIKGQIQGVGFRPFVFRIANQLGINGWVNNTTDGVHVEFNGNKKLANDFTDRILNEHPSEAIIEYHHIKVVKSQPYDNFRIVKSKSTNNFEVRISPDFGLCKACKQELQEPDNRRFEYAFTTCTHCGPRYSIITQLPYDRPNTEMHHFMMCADCRKEYIDPSNRRFYSQTNSCPDCAINLNLFHHGNLLGLDNREIINKIKTELDLGNIIAVKGIGGYLLLGLADSFPAISLLRKRKNRPHKPFAVMYPDIESVKRDFNTSKEQASILQSTQSPILLLRPKDQSENPLAMNEIAPGLGEIGVMLPYAPLLYNIIQNIKKPLIATSGNISGSPIVYEDQLALEKLVTFSDYILTHDRKIVVPQDDSVMRYNQYLKKPIILRRSRGLAPSYFGQSEIPNNWLALGAHMKSAFSISYQDQIYISQYLGNLDSYDAQLEFIKTYRHLKNLLNLKPQRICTDMHPQYHVYRLANELKNEYNAKISYIQHHKSHFAAVLKENGLINTKKPVMGVIWDGSGYGEDGNIWGGEFFSYQNHFITRTNHMDEVPLLMGDKMAYEPRIAALSFTNQVLGYEKHLHPKFSDTEWNYYNHQLKNKTWIKTTSIGRLFDAVASILGLLDRSTFEGQGAMYLEALAKSCKTEGLSPYTIELSANGVGIQSMFGEILNDLNDHKETCQIALRFHLTLAHMIKLIALANDFECIAFSGGVFQNNLLIDLIHKNLSGQFTLYFHKELSPNDENIAFGQLVATYLNELSEKTNV